MFAFLLQDWLTVRGSSPVAVAQSEPFWLDMSGYKDLVTWLEVKEFTATAGSLYVQAQTSPSKDEALFQSMTGNVAVAAGVTTTNLLSDMALVPLARWLRWQLVPTATATSWDITFRLWVTASRPGRAAVRSPLASLARALAL